MGFCLAITRPSPGWYRESDALYSLWTPAEEEQEERKKKSFEIVFSLGMNFRSGSLVEYLRRGGVSEEFAEMVDLTVVLRAETEDEEQLARKEIEQQEEDWVKKLAIVELVQ